MISEAVRKRHIEERRTYIRIHVFIYRNTDMHNDMLLFCIRRIMQSLIIILTRVHIPESSKYTYQLARVLNLTKAFHGFHADSCSSFTKLIAGLPGIFWHC